MSSTYFDLLCRLINMPREYSELIKQLHAIRFFWIFELDGNRNDDGIVLRNDFVNESYDSDVIDNATVLEVLIALSQKMDYILWDEFRGDRSRIWFWEMLENLGLLVYTNDYISQDYERRSSEIQLICDRWMSRNFDYNGRGSPFPLDHPAENQKNIDIVLQMNAYIMEKHMYNDELL